MDHLGLRLAARLKLCRVDVWELMGTDPAAVQSAPETAEAAAWTPLP